MPKLVKVASVTPHERPNAKGRARAAGAGRPFSGRVHKGIRAMPNTHEWINANKLAIEAWAKSGKLIPSPPSDDVVL